MPDTTAAEFVRRLNECAQEHELYKALRSTAIAVLYPSLEVPSGYDIVENGKSVAGDDLVLQVFSICHARIKQEGWPATRRKG